MLLYEPLIAWWKWPLTEFCCMGHWIPIQSYWFETYIECYHLFDANVPIWNFLADFVLWLADGLFRNIFNYFYAFFYKFCSLFDNNFDQLWVLTKSAFSRFFAMRPPDLVLIDIMSNHPVAGSIMVNAHNCLVLLLGYLNVSHGIFGE